MSAVKVVVILPNGYPLSVKVPNDLPVKDILPRLTGMINGFREQTKRARYQLETATLKKAEYQKTLQELGIHQDHQLTINLGPTQRGKIKLSHHAPENETPPIILTKHKETPSKKISKERPSSRIKLQPKRKNQFLKVKEPPFDDSFLWPCRLLRENLPLKIYYTIKANIELSLHSSSNLKQEVGGILVGHVYESLEEEMTFVVITDSIIGQFTVESAIQLNFTHETWIQIQEEKEKCYPDKEIVGWYHTHPNLGIFLSQQDLFIHENFFKEPWQVALVLDPVARKGGFFQWEKGKKLHNKPFSEFQLVPSELSFQKHEYRSR